MKYSIKDYHQQNQKENDSIGFVFLGAFIMIALFVIMPMLSYYL